MTNPNKGNASFFFFGTSGRGSEAREHDTRKTVLAAAGDGGRTRKKRKGRTGGRRDVRALVALKKPSCCRGPFFFSPVFWSAFPSRETENYRLPAEAWRYIFKLAEYRRATVLSIYAVPCRFLKIKTHKYKNTKNRIGATLRLTRMGNQKRPTLRNCGLFLPFLRFVVVVVVDDVLLLSTTIRPFRVGGFLVGEQLQLGVLHGQSGQTFQPVHGIGRAPRKTASEGPDELSETVGQTRETTGCDRTRRYY